MGDVILRRKIIEMNHSSSTTSNSSNSSSSRMTTMLQAPTKTERKVIEKNRRNQMKTLYSILYSLIPKHPSKEALPLPDQIDEAISYIKSLEEKIKKSKEKKETLSSSLSKKRPFSSLCTSGSAPEPTPILKSPKLKISEIGSSLQISLTSGSENQFLFNEIINILHEENVDVVSASSSRAGDLLFHIVHAQMSETGLFNFGAARVTERLNWLINGSTSEIELEPELWDFNDLQPETWMF